MAENHLPAFLPGGQRQKFSGLKIMVHPFENPGIPFSGPADHDAVAARLIEQCLRFFRGIHVAVSNDRNGNRLFHLADDLPVRFTGIILLPRPAMNGDGSRSGGFQALRHLHGVDAVLGKSFPDLHGHGLFDGLRDTLHDFSRKGGIFHEGGAFAVVDDLRHRTAHVDIQDIKGQILNRSRHLRHQLRLRAKELKSHGIFSWSNL